MENIKEKFTKAIHDKVKLRITYQADKYKSKITRLCAPMDIKQKEKDSSKAVKYHFWDYEGREGSHTTSKLLKDIYSVEVTSIRFNPSDFVTWDKTNWGISRDWGKFS